MNSLTPHKPIIGYTKFARTDFDSPSVEISSHALAGEESINNVLDNKSL